MQRTLTFERDVAQRFEGSSSASGGVENEDEFDFVQMRNEISAIVKKNIENTKKSLEVFSKYAYLLTELRRI